MVCVKCKSAAPENVVSFNSANWVCPKCEANKLIDELLNHYKSGVSGRYLYISEFTNNLDKVNNFILENVELNNPHCTITLTLPEGCPYLRGGFDGIYIDQGSVTENDLKMIIVNQNGYVSWINPLTQEIGDVNR